MIIYPYIWGKSLHMVATRGYMQHSSGHLHLDQHSHRLDFSILTHWGRVTHICVGNQTIIGWDNALNQCWDIINWTLWNKLQENALEGVVCEMAAILSRRQCVKYFEYVSCGYQNGTDIKQTLEHTRVRDSLTWKWNDRWIVGCTLAVFSLSTSTSAGSSSLSKLCNSHDEWVRCNVLILSFE